MLKEIQQYLKFPFIFFTTLSFYRNKILLMAMRDKIIFFPIFNRKYII